MRLQLIWVGKTRNEHLRALTNDYLARLQHFVRCEVKEVREGGGRGANEREVLASEERHILAALSADAIGVLLDENGQRWNSRELAGQIEDWQTRGVKEVAFIIGGYCGVSAEIKKRVAVCWSLSPLTFTHEMARVILAEQIYRAFTIMRGLPYQK